MIYFVPLTISLLGAYIIEKKGQCLYLEKPLKLLLYLLMVLIVSLRYKVGGDTINYMGYYQWQGEISSWKLQLFDSNSFQPLFTLLFSLCKTVSDNFVFFQFVHAILFLSLLFYFIHKNTEYFFVYIFFALIIFYLYFTTEILRESLAVIVFALNWKNYIENKYVRYYIGVIVSMGFHISASFLLILPMLKWIKLDYKYFLVLMSVCVLGWLMWPPKLPILSAIPMLETKMSGYLSHSSGGLLFSILVLIRYTIIPITVVFLLKKYYNNVQYENTLCALSLFGVFSIFSFVIFTRFINYFTPILVLAIAELIGKMFNSKYYSTRNTAGILVVIMFFAYASYYVHLDMYKRWWPYSSIINPVEYIRNQNE